MSDTRTRNADDLFEALGRMSPVELREFVAAFEAKFGVTAAPPKYAKALQAETEAEKLTAAAEKLMAEADKLRQDAAFERVKLAITRLEKLGGRVELVQPPRWRDRDHCGWASACGGGWWSFAMDQRQLFAPSRRPR